jgi:hypothetical protein
MLLLLLYALLLYPPAHNCLQPTPLLGLLLPKDGAAAAAGANLQSLERTWIV